MRRDGVYLLVLPGQTFGIPYTLKNQRNPDGTFFQLLAGVDGIKLTVNLEEGYELIPLVVMTPARVDALRYLWGDRTPGENIEQHLNVLSTIIEDLTEIQP